MFFDTGLHSYFGFSGGTRRDTECLFFPFPTNYPVNYQSTKLQSNEQQEEKRGQTDFSYYGLYLLDYLRTNKFEQADDTAFIRERADRAAETYEKARLEGYPADGAQELAMDTLLRGLHYSRYAILREVGERVLPMKCRKRNKKPLSLKLLPLVGLACSPSMTSRMTIFALSSDYDLLYTELTGATVLYIGNMAFNRKETGDNIEGDTDGIHP